MSGLQNWRTPPQLFAQIQREFGPFTMDVAADARNSLAPMYYDEANDGLAPGSTWYGAVWCNPPYGRPLPWVQRAVDHARHSRVVMLLPAALDTRWGQLLATKSHWWLTAGRVRFVHPGTGQVGDTPPSGHVVAVFSHVSLDAGGRWMGYRDPLTGVEI